MHRGILVGPVKNGAAQHVQGEERAGFEDLP